MKYLIYIVLFICFAVTAKSQDPFPRGVPTQKINGWIENWYTVPDSGAVISRRDTSWHPRFLGMTVTWPHAGVDTVQWFWDGGRWNRNGASANNGLSNSGSIQLGQAVGAGGNPAILINNREIPTGGFNTFFSGTGGLGIGTTSLISGNKLQVNGNAGFTNVRLGALSTFIDAPISAGMISSIPFMSFYDASAAADEKIWDFQVMGNTFTFNIWNDIISANSTVMTVRRSATNVASVAFPNGIWQYGGGTPLTSFSIFSQDAMRLPGGTTAQRPTGHEGFFRFNSDSANAPEYFDGTNWVRLAAAIGNPLTSIGLSMPSAFTVSTSPLTSNGTFNVSGAGTTAQYIRGNGTLATTDTGMIPNFYLKVRGLLIGTSPITFNQTTGAIGINNANTTGGKGAATFNNGDFTDDGFGLISLRNSPVAKVDTIFRIPGIDSIFFTINSVQHSILDSLGVTITANNGLTKTGNNIQLGGSLIQPTAITSAAGANRITYSGVSAFGDGAQLDVTTSGSSGIAIQGNSTDGRGVLGVATTGVGVYGTAPGSGGIGLFGVTSDGSAVYVQTLGGKAFEGFVDPSSTNTVIPVISLTRSSSVTGANGIGSSIDFNLRTTTSDQLSNQIIVKLTDATNALYTSSMEFWNANNGTLGVKASLSGPGLWNWPGYPGSTAQTDTTTYKPIAYDASGNIVPMIGWPVGSSGGGGSSDTLIESSAGTLTLAQRGDYVFNGSTTTWTLPALGSNLRTVYYIKNAGSGNITLNRAGSDNIYSTSSVTSYTIGAGTSIRLVGGITFWYVEL